ncbi:hypothetical protein BDN71DRAFT_1431297 [Pleurotus eryngii]|uniref:Uncharacterized protein n=1 Tax=Pleurotus eryngii TaxID=5323 RepID=A0A9P5ZV18_PLEER|nr:hypothetical protein BDN71DRAFT_1431297 [Pleurotus eryngii]
MLALPTDFYPSLDTRYKTSCSSLRPGVYKRNIHMVAMENTLSLKIDVAFYLLALEIILVLDTVSRRLYLAAVNITPHMLSTPGTSSHVLFGDIDIPSSYQGSLSTGLIRLPPRRACHNVQGNFLTVVFDPLRCWQPRGLIRSSGLAAVAVMIAEYMTVRYRNVNLNSRGTRAHHGLGQTRVIGCG